jgi:hypothetical protein
MQYRTACGARRTVRAMADRRHPTKERNAAPVGPRNTLSQSPRLERAMTAAEADPRRPNKFGSATDGWDAYNSWLDRVRQPAPPSRQAVIAKALYSVSSYKNWADKARGAFDKVK